jgi:hypothetical protein
MDADTTLGVTQLGSTLLAVGGMEWLKGQAWFPMLQKDSPILNRIGSIVIAACIALGIHYTWNPSPDGGHILVLAIPSTAALVTAAFHWGSQFAFQHASYRGLQAMKNLAVIATDILAKAQAAKS